MVCSPRPTWLASVERDRRQGDFGLLYRNRLNVLRKAYTRFTPGKDYTCFVEENSNWLPDFTLFMALKDKFGGKPWYEWEHDLKFRNPDAIWNARNELKEEISFFSFVQYLFFQQWNALHAYAKKNNISIIGDVPIYVPRDSVEAWSSPELFQMDEKLDPKAVAGCPPDAFAADGQLWGNPLYRWDVLAEDGYSWWLRRLALPESCMTWCGWITSAPSRATGPCPSATPPPGAASGLPAPALTLSTP